VTVIGCPETCAVIPAEPATEEDWMTEYLDYKLSVRIVGSIDQAIDHINRYGSRHTDAIITSSREKAARFMELVDSGNVFWNCSTRFSDGFRYGFGAEVGISTGKIHARGPVGLEGLVIYKYKLIGNGHIVDDYAKKLKTFKHRKIDREFPCGC
jgi:glutamate-5-semialdehyde dehydrogenase